MKVTEIQIPIGGEIQDFFIASFANDFEAFRTEEMHVWAYLDAGSWSSELEHSVKDWLRSKSQSLDLKVKEIEERNWNEEWEKTIQPISSGGFTVLPSWSNEPDAGTQAIVIDPKMSFGTGHHETTRLMLKMMRPVIQKSDLVLDAGTGTGVLAIAAVILGSRKVIAFDIDEWSTRNGIENRKVNDISEDMIDFRTGAFEETVTEDQFDVVLANINRNTLIELLPKFKEHLKDQGLLLISGVLKADKAYFLEKAQGAGFTHEKGDFENEWISLLFKLEG